MIALATRQFGKVRSGFYKDNKKIQTFVVMLCRLTAALQEKNVFQLWPSRVLLNQQYPVPLLWHLSRQHSHGENTAVASWTPMSTSLFPVAKEACFVKMHACMLFNTF